MYKIRKKDFNKSGHIPNSVKLSKFDTVLRYLGNFTKSNEDKNYGLDIPHIRNLIIDKILKKDFGFTTSPQLEVQFEFIYDNFPAFKKALKEYLNNR